MNMKSIKLKQSLPKFEAIIPSSIIKSLQNSQVIENVVIDNYYILNSNLFVEKNQGKIIEKLKKANSKRIFKVQTIQPDIKPIIKMFCSHGIELIPFIITQNASLHKYLIQIYFPFIASSYTIKNIQQESIPKKNILQNPIYEMIITQNVSTCGVQTIDNINRKILQLKSDHNISKIDIKGLWISLQIRNNETPDFNNKLKAQIDRLLLKTQSFYNNKTIDLILLTNFDVINNKRENKCIVFNSILETSSVSIQWHKQTYQSCRVSSNINPDLFEQIKVSLTSIPDGASLHDEISIEPEINMDIMFDSIQSNVVSGQNNNNNNTENINQINNLDSASERFVATDKTNKTGDLFNSHMDINELSGVTNHLDKSLLDSKNNIRNDSHEESKINKHSDLFELSDTSVLGISKKSSDNVNNINQNSNNLNQNQQRINLDEIKEENAEYDIRQSRNTDSKTATFDRNFNNNNATKSIELSLNNIKFQNKSNDKKINYQSNSNPTEIDSLARCEDAFSPDNRNIIQESHFANHNHHDNINQNQTGKSDQFQTHKLNNLYSTQDDMNNTRIKNENDIVLKNVVVKLVNILQQNNLISSDQVEEINYILRGDQSNGLINNDNMTTLKSTVTENIRTNPNLIQNPISPNPNEDLLKTQPPNPNQITSPNIPNYNYPPNQSKSPNPTAIPIDREDSANQYETSTNSIVPILLPEKNDIGLKIRKVFDQDDESKLNLISSESIIQFKNKDKLQLNNCQGNDNQLKFQQDIDKNNKGNDHGNDHGKNNNFENQMASHALINKTSVSTNNNSTFFEKSQHQEKYLNIKETNVNEQSEIEDVESVDKTNVEKLRNNVNELRNKFNNQQEMVDNREETNKEKVNQYQDNKQENNSNYNQYEKTQSKENEQSIKNKLNNYNRPEFKSETKTNSKILNRTSDLSDKHKDNSSTENEIHNKRIMSENRGSKNESRGQVPHSNNSMELDRIIKKQM